MSTRYHGVAASDGIAIGPLFVLGETSSEVIERHDVQVKDELLRLEKAAGNTRSELSHLYNVAREKMGDENAQIFVAHLQILDDPEFLGTTRQMIETHLVNAEYALVTVSARLVSMFEGIEDEYLRQRSADIKDISTRVLGHLQGRQSTGIADLHEPAVLAARDLTPSDTVLLDKQLVRGFITDVGGRTSHSAIMARSLGIPAVVGLGDVTNDIQPGTTVIVNGFDGEVIVSPTEEELSTFESRLKQETEQAKQLLAFKTEQTITRDGHRVELAGNIGSQKDLAAVLHNGGEGVGLFRSEFLFMNRSTPPTEEEQFEAYRAVAQGLNGRPVIIRTLDVGGDKEIPYLHLPEESNPFLGYRAIRVCLDDVKLFKTQLRAVLRASNYGNVKMMFPMISNITEIRKAKQLVEEVKDELRTSGVPFDESMEVGIMVEIPASAVAADVLAKEVDFFSIGTNDLIQYTMACDRMNERISSLYQPYHPAILRLVKMVIDGGHRQGKWVGMCGEMAGDLTAVPLLLGLGLDEFSMSASSILKVRQAIHSMSQVDAARLAQDALEQDSEEAIKTLVMSWQQEQHS